MSEKAIFQKAFAYGDDLMALPVANLDSAAHWYAEHFAMVEVERKGDPQPTVVMERDQVRIGFSVNELVGWGGLCCHVAHLGVVSGAARCGGRAKGHRRSDLRARRRMLQLYRHHNEYNLC